MTTTPASKAAQDILKTTWCSTSEIDDSCRLPIDPIVIARRLGMEVYTSEIGNPDVAGMLIKDANRDPEIYLNARDHPNRQRFSCAHEIGHYVHRADNDSAAWEYIDYRSSLSSTGTDPVERFANGFAAELLMPEQLVRLHAQELSRGGLASLFKVSMEAMGHRLKNLGL